MYDAAMRLPDHPARFGTALAVLILGVMAASCSTPAAEQRHLRPAAASRPTTAPARDLAGVAVIYAGHGEPAPLSPERKRKILEAAAEDVPDGEVWFVLVLSNHEERYAANVYFAPDQTSPRLRRGKYVYVSDQRDWWKRLPERHRRQLAREPGPIPTYVQVSMRNEPFDDPLTPPSLPLAPFDPEMGQVARPARLNDREIVELVDLTRPLLRFEDYPIHAIAIEEGVIRVYTGWQVGPLVGTGEFVDFKRKEGGGFRRVGGVGMWVS